MEIFKSSTVFEKSSKTSYSPFVFFSPIIKRSEIYIKTISVRVSTPMALLIVKCTLSDNQTQRSILISVSYDFFPWNENSKFRHFFIRLMYKKFN